MGGNLVLSLKEWIYHETDGLLHEGGNVVVNGIEAQKIDLQKIPRQVLKSLLTKMLIDFNNKYSKFTGKPLWNDVEKLIKSTLLFSGSTRVLFVTDIPDQELTEFKPKLGDIDIQFPVEEDKELKSFLKKNIGKKFGDLTYKGDGGNSIIQTNTIFETPKKFHPDVRFIQIDFEPTHFDNDVPNEFSTFGHFSSWTDIKSNIKGKFRADLWRALAGQEKLKNAVVLTKMGKISTVGKFANPNNISKFALSPDRGLRVKFVPVLDKNNKIMQVNGKNAFREIPTSESNYETSLAAVFTIGIGRPPKGNEVKSMFSFIRTLKLMRKHLDNLTIDKVFLHFVELIWGVGAPSLSRNDPEEDKNMKLSAYNQFINEFPFLKKHQRNIDKMIEKYYKGFKIK